MFWLILACNQQLDSGIKSDIADSDGDGSSRGEDCDDHDPARFPGALELCDEIDNNCDGRVDEDAEDATLYYRDADGDGYGVAALTAKGCGPQEGYVDDATDCDDLLSSVHPDAEEVCDGVDQDCDGEIDEDPVDGPSWTLDEDGDGFGGTTVIACERPAEAVDDTSDCDDGNSQVFPGSHHQEVPGDGEDEDCDGLDACVDLSCDGWPDLVFAGSNSPWLKGPNFVVGGVLGGSPTVSVAAGDLDHDGYLDLVLASNYNGSYRVDSRLVYGGSGGPGASTLSLATTGASSVVLTDIDGDGWEDAVIAQSQSDSGWDVSSQIWWNNAGKLENPEEVYTVGARDVAVADLNGDGRSDLIFACKREDGGVTSSTAYLSPDFMVKLLMEEAEGVCAGDLDNDGDSDFVLMIDGGAQVYVNNAGTILKDAFYPSTATDCLIADMTGDGNQLLLIGDTTETTDQQFVFPTPGGSGAWVQDLDLDGKPDLVVSASSGRAQWMPGMTDQTELGVSGTLEVAGW